MGEKKRERGLVGAGDALRRGKQLGQFQFDAERDDPSMTFSLCSVGWGGKSNCHGTPSSPSHSHPPGLFFVAATPRPRNVQQAKRLCGALSR